MKWKFYSLAFVAGMSILTACSSDDNNDNDGNGGNGNGNEIENGTILKGTITSDVTLAAGNTYKLSGEYIVEEGATLHIEEGVKIIAVYDDIADYILVKQGGKINAVGTPDKPIVMTSEKEEPGAWGGIHICGRAHTNAEGGKGSSEIGGAVYGGNDDADNSGTLQYIRLEYTGFAFDEEHEANGISFYGVGNGTIVDHCQAYKGSDDGFEFFGGISHGVEKRSHVRSRIIANALADQIRQSDSVIIMGHRQSDLDAIGSAIGLLRMCKMCDVPSVIAVRSKATLAGQLLDVFNKAGEDHNFIEPEETYKLITPKTLLIVTDTYQKRLLEDQKIYEKCSRVVVIDHHRMAVGHIDNPILLYHEPFASSASELVCELLQFMPAQNNITQLEAQALLSGIMLDTRSFALHVGVRTFEAAAWLRSRGAETAATKRLFNISKEEYEARATIVEGAYLYKGCAIATSDELDPAMSVVLPMAANDLLTINGVDASFVAIAKNGGVNISARSMGALNVQVILEPLGGGGHLTMAGAQLRDCTVKEAEARIRAQIDEYRANQECQEELVGAV